MKEKILIVGGGLAGSILGYILHKKYPCDLEIIDDYGNNKASLVAAGIYNPIVFKRLVCSWKADELITCLDEFYNEIEKELNVSFHFKKEILKLFADDEEINIWKKKSHHPDIKKYIQPEPILNFREDILNEQKAFGKVINAGNLNTSAFLSALHIYFEKQGILTRERFDYESLKLEADKSISYHQKNFSKVIFCEGYRAIYNPWFNWLEFKLTKGELLTISAPLNIEKEVINKGVFILPYGDNIYKVGATYEWDNLDETPTEKGKNELIEKLNRLIKVPYQIISHEAGIRPTVKDRRPILGSHPSIESMLVFNGLGTKGVMLAPYFAKKLAGYIFENTRLEDEINIMRFWRG